MKTTDLTRDRKVRMTLRAMHLLTLGLAMCLLAGVARHDIAALLVGLYAPFGLGIGGALGLFINGNVRVHQAQAQGQPGGNP